MTREIARTSRMNAGKWIRELREERSVRSSDIERVSRSIADVKGDPDFYLSHSTLADVETGAVPSIHKLVSLAVCLQVPLEELLLGFGIDSQEIRQCIGQGEPSVRNSLAIPDREPGFRFQLNFDAGFNSQDTRLLTLNPQELAGLPAAQFRRLDPKRYRYAAIGLEDDSMGDLIPPGSLVEIDVNQNAVQVSDWKSMRERPVYLIWHTEGHSCCWCDLQGKELTLLPYPLSRQSVRRFRVPREASVIGRVINAWLPFDQLPNGR